MENEKDLPHSKGIWVRVIGIIGLLLATLYTFNSLTHEAQARTEKVIYFVRPSGVTRGFPVTEEMQNSTVEDWRDNTISDPAIKRGLADCDFFALRSEDYLFLVERSRFEPIGEPLAIAGKNEKQIRSLIGEWTSKITDLNQQGKPHNAFTSVPSSDLSLVTLILKRHGLCGVVLAEGIDPRNCYFVMQSEKGKNRVPFTKWSQIKLPNKIVVYIFKQSNLYKQTFTLIYGGDEAILINAQSGHISKVYKYTYEFTIGPTDPEYENLHVAERQGSSNGYVVTQVAAPPKDAK